MKKATPENTKKRPYLLPTITKLNLEQAKQKTKGDFVVLKVGLDDGCAFSATSHLTVPSSGRG
jgi:heterodisulfide reductase subunit B